MGVICETKQQALSSSNISINNALKKTKESGTSLNAEERIFTVDEHNKPTLYGHSRPQVRVENLWHRATYIIVRHEPEEQQEHEQKSEKEEIQAKISNNNGKKVGNMDEDNFYILVQRRSKSKDYCQGRLDPTLGGVVQFGESYELNAKREIQEQMGIILPNDVGNDDEIHDGTKNKENVDKNIKNNNGNRNQMRHLFTFPFEDDHVRCWGALYEVVYRGRIEDLAIQEEEVQDVSQITLAHCRKLIEGHDADSRDILSSCAPDSLHALKLYLQYRLDRGVNRRLLDGYSYNNLENYRPRPKPQAIFFDCDDSLYFDNWRIMKQFAKKNKEWFTKHGLPAGDAYGFYKKYGLSLRGLFVEGHISRTDKDAIDQYLKEVHDIPIEEMLQPDLKLREIIKSIDPTIPKYIFTASVHHHAERCVKALGIDDLFDGIIDVKACDFQTKYSKEAFLAAMNIAGVTNPECCIFLDDSMTNIKAAKEMKWRSILVGRVGRDGKPFDSSKHAEHEVDRIHEITNVLPELFN